MEGGKVVSIKMLKFNDCFMSINWIFTNKLLKFDAIKRTNKGLIRSESIT
jgi:hypothetical protein